MLVALLFAGFASAYAVYEPPTLQEQDLFGQLFSQFEKTDVAKKDVSDVIQTFTKPLVISFACNRNDTNNFVIVVISTRLAKFDNAVVHEDQVIGGTYTWDCLVTTEDGKVTLQCNNELRLNPALLLNNTGESQQVHEVENDVVLYHEFLHGQLMIDAINSSSTWRHEICNLEPGGTVDYTYADPDHKIINPLQTQFASELMQEQGGQLVTKYISPNQTQDGRFAIKAFEISDYLQFRNGGEVTLRAVNINDTKFGSYNNTIFLEGSLINHTEPGIAWLYVTDNQANQTTNTLNPILAKKIVGMWANGQASNEDFYDAIQSIIMQPSSTNYTQSIVIPQWMKNTALWWFEGKIDDATFENTVQYLVSDKIIH